METAKVKGFFERPEGKLGMVVIVAMVVGVLIGLDKITPFLIRVLENTIHTAILIGVILGAIFLITNKQFQAICINLFKNTMRWITGWVITIDPIGILKNYLDEMKANMSKMQDQITKLNGQKHNLIQTINKRKTEGEQHEKMALAAKKKGDMHNATLYARKMERAVDSVNKLEVPLQKMEMIHTVLTKMKKNIHLLYEDTKDEILVREEEYEGIKSAHAAMSSAQKLINGSSQKEMFEQSMEFLAEDIAMKIGEMDEIMEASTNFMDSIDLQNSVWDEKGLATLERIEKGGKLFNYDEKKSPEPGLSSNFKADKDKFANFFNKNGNV